MTISYKKLWKLLIDKDMGRTQMANEAGITGNLLGRLSRNEPVSMGSMEKICPPTSDNLKLSEVGYGTR
ncbi:MAG: helix-turn-helix transcriptional regulator [Clostridiales bacterium]|nr:helix-turn-helix transcriptional regulator [Clostridiales bacterium]